MKKPNIYTNIEIEKIEAISLALIQKQLKAYNNRDIEAFLEPFSENIKGYNYPNKLIFEGKEEMSKGYAQLFEAFPNLHCKTISRTVLKDIVIDKELLTGIKVMNENVVQYWVAIYKIESNKISEVRFLNYVSH